MSVLNTFNLRRNEKICSAVYRKASESGISSRKRRGEKKNFARRFVLDAVVLLSKVILPPLSSAFVAVVWELPFTRCRARILIHPENYSTVICLTTFAILRADRSLSSYLIIFLSFFSFLPFFPSSFLSPRSNRPSRASHERVARSILLMDSRGFRCLKRELISKDEYFIVLVLVISTKKKVISYGR